MSNMFRFKKLHNLTNIVYDEMRSNAIIAIHTETALN